MRALVLDRPREPLRLVERPRPEPGPGQVRLRVRACGVCRTDLHVVDGELPDLGRAVVPGHQIVGVVDAVGPGRRRGSPSAQRVGVPWLGWTCGALPVLPARPREPLRAGPLHRLPRSTEASPSTRSPTSASASRCPTATATRRPRRCSARGSSATARCAWPATAERLGLYGFGAAAHIVDRRSRATRAGSVFAFTRPGDARGAGVRALARRVVGGRLRRRRRPSRSTRRSSSRPRASWCPPRSRAVDRGGTVVCAGIHMSDIPAFPYRLLWEERVVRSVANLTRRDGEEFLALAPRVPVRTRGGGSPARGGERGARAPAQRPAARRGRARRRLNQFFSQLPYMAFGKRKKRIAERRERAVGLLADRLAEAGEVEDVVAEERHDVERRQPGRRRAPRDRLEARVLVARSRSGMHSIASKARPWARNTSTVSAHSDSARFVTTTIFPPSARTRRGTRRPPAAASPREARSTPASSRGRTAGPSAPAEPGTPSCR